MKNTIHCPDYFKHIFTERINQVVYVSINKQLINFPKFFQHSVLALPGKGLKDIFSSEMIHRKHNIVVGNILPKSYGLSGHELHLPSVFFFPAFLINILYAFLYCFIHATCPNILILVDLVTLIIFNYCKKITKLLVVQLFAASCYF